MSRLTTLNGGEDWALDSSVIMQSLDINYYTLHYSLYQQQVRCHLPRDTEAAATAAASRCLAIMLSTCDILELNCLSTDDAWAL